MKRPIIFSTLLVAVLSVTGCMKMDCGQDSEPEFSQPVLFQYEYYNYAWGFRHHGFLIDEEGRINGFEEPKKWITPDSSGFMSKADLEYNLVQCDTFCGKVDKEDMAHYFRKIGEVRDSKIKDNGMVMADAGTGVFSAWYWNRREQMYENVFLVSNGDVSRINTHESIMEMIEWLKRAGEKTNRFWWFEGK